MYLEITDISSIFYVPLAIEIDYFHCKTKCGNTFLGGFLTQGAISKEDLIGPRNGLFYSCCLSTLVLDQKCEAEFDQVLIKTSFVFLQKLCFKNT